MTVLLMLIPISLLFVAAGAVAFFWAVNHDQFDDMDTPGLLPLADSDLVAGGDPARQALAGGSAAGAAGEGRTDAAPTRSAA